MKVWLPYVRAGSGVDVYTRILARGLESQGCEVVMSPFAHNWQYFPWRLCYMRPPEGVDVILTNSWNGFAFARDNAKLVVVEHHCIFDQAYLPYRSRGQALFHEGLVRRFELASFKAADAAIAVSHYTADSLHATLGITGAQVIHNGIDTEFFSPSAASSKPRRNTHFRVLFIGNPSRRKGADLLPLIMRMLGEGFELRYTGGLRNEEGIEKSQNLRALGRLDDEQLREEYRQTDVLLFPSRLEGFGYAAAEAMACGTPVVAANSSSLPEVVADGASGILCPVDDIDAFVNAIRRLHDAPALLEQYGTAARLRAVEAFSIARMAKQYVECFTGLIGSDKQPSFNLPTSHT